MDADIDKAWEAFDDGSFHDEDLSVCMFDLRARREKYEEIVADQAREIADLRERHETWVRKSATMLDVGKNERTEWRDRVAKLEDHIRLAMECRHILARRATEAEERDAVLEKRLDHHAHKRYNSVSEMVDDTGKTGHATESEQPSGERVIFEGAGDAQVQRGNCDDPRKHLVVGNSYAVKRREVHSWHTKIELVVTPGLLFDATCFLNAEASPEQPVEVDDDTEREMFLDAVAEQGLQPDTPKTCETCGHNESGEAAHEKRPI